MASVAPNDLACRRYVSFSQLRHINQVLTSSSRLSMVSTAIIVLTPSETAANKAAMPTPPIPDMSSVDSGDGFATLSTAPARKVSEPALGA